MITTDINKINIAYICSMCMSNNKSTCRSPAHTVLYVHIELSIGKMKEHIIGLFVIHQNLICVRRGALRYNFYEIIIINVNEIDEM